jgi:hypothetical protein
VDAVPLPATEALLLLPGTLRGLHALAPFPKSFNYTTAHNGFIWRFRRAGLLPQEEIEEVFTRYEAVCAAYPRLAEDMVSCHMDLKPDNILFDGERVWLVDWQAGFVNDRYFDLAVAANFVVTNDVDEGIYLEQYFGHQPDEYQRARFFLMRQVVHMMSAAIFLLLGAGGKPIEHGENLPSFREFHRRIWAGEVDLADNHTKILCGMVHWQELLRNVRRTRFDEALGIVSARNKGDAESALLLPSAP